MSHLVAGAWFINIIAFVSGLLVRRTHLVPDESTYSEQERGSDQERRHQC
jgi:hypothetical protein